MVQQFIFMENTKMDDWIWVHNLLQSNRFCLQLLAVQKTNN